MCARAPKSATWSTFYWQKEVNGGGGIGFGNKVPSGSRKTPSFLLQYSFLRSARGAAAKFTKEEEISKRAQDRVGQSFIFHFSATPRPPRLVP